MAIAESPDKPHEENCTSAEPTSGEESDSAGEDPHHAPSDRLKGFSAVLIALIAALGAVVTWRAEVAASTAAVLTQQGVVVSINLAAEQSKDRAMALGEEADVMRVQQLLDERDLLSDQMAVTPAGPAQHELATEYNVQYWVAEWQLRSAWAANFYLHNAATTPTYDVASRTADLVSESRIPTNSAYSFTRADSEQHKRSNLLLLDIGLVIGLSFATVVPLVRRRLQIFCAASGSAIFFLGVIAFWMLEV